MEMKQPVLVGMVLGLTAANAAAASQCDEVAMVMTAADSYRADDLERAEQKLYRDPGDLEAHGVRVAYIASHRKHTQAPIDSVLTLIDACSDSALFASPEVAAIRHPSIDRAWQRRVRIDRSASVVANAWSYWSFGNALPKAQGTTHELADVEHLLNAHEELALALGTDHPSARRAAATALREALAQLQRPTGAAFEDIEDIEEPSERGELLATAAGMAQQAGKLGLAETLASRLLVEWNQQGRFPMAQAGRAIERLESLAAARGNRSLAHSLGQAQNELWLDTPLRPLPPITAIASVDLEMPTDVPEPLASCADLSGSPTEQLAAARTWNAAVAAKLNRALRRDAGDLRAHAQRLAYYATHGARSSAVVMSAEWLIVACPNLPLLARPEVARIAGADTSALWNRVRRRSATAATHGNYWSHVAATRPLDVRSRRTDPRLSEDERRQRILALESASRDASDYPTIALRAFEAWRAEIRDQRKSAPLRRPFSIAARVDPLDRAVPYLEAAAAAYGAGFQDTAERFAGEFLAHWARAGRPASPHVDRALMLMSNSAQNRGDESLARSLREAARRGSPSWL